MYNFGTIKETYNKIYIDAFSTEDEKKKKIFEYYIGKVNNIKILKEEFEAYYNIQNKTFDGELESQIFIQDNVDTVKSIDFLELSKIHKDLMEHIKKSGYELVTPDDEKISLFETLLTLDKKAKNLSKISESLVKLRKHMISESAEQHKHEIVNIPMNELSSLMADKFNKKYSDLDESTKNIIKVSLNGTIDDKISMYNSTIKECLSSINGKLKTEKDLDLKDKLLQTKEKLLEMSFGEDTYIDDLSKVIDLKTNL
jgi:hypothetical protein